jgi:hypothetical protein
MYFIQGFSWQEDTILGDTLLDEHSVVVVQKEIVRIPLHGFIDKEKTDPSFFWKTDCYLVDKFGYAELIDFKLEGASLFFYKRYEQHSVRIAHQFMRRMDGSYIGYWKVSAGSTAIAKGEVWCKIIPVTEHVPTKHR